MVAKVYKCRYNYRYKITSTKIHSSSLPVEVLDVGLTLQGAILRFTDICHTMRERRLCLWTASQSSPFRLDFEEAYFNISWSPEMLVPLSGGIALRYQSRASPESKRVS